MPTPEHNPQNIRPSEIPPGYRLCRESEREKLPADAKFLTYLQGQPNWWKDSCGQVKALEHWKEYTYITFTPLPESEREVPAASPWIPLADRPPTASDWDETHGVLYGDRNRKTKPNQWLVTEFPATPSSRATHWRRVELPPLPPAPAKTQREKDNLALLHAASDILGQCAPNYDEEKFYHSALETERAHFGGVPSEDIKNILLKALSDQHDFASFSEVIASIVHPNE